MFVCLLGLCGVLAGITTALFGFGGGFVAVPLLFTLITASHPPDSATALAAMHIAVATSTAAMIFSSALSTLRHSRAGSLSWSMVRPLLGYISVGAAIGAWAALQVSGAWIRWLFIGYLALSILDALLRPGFVVQPGTDLRPLGRAATALTGTGIGAIAAFLGVGGSVMSVPLMRRRGASMAVATASASPLSLPMAAAGTVMYGMLAWHSAPLGPGFVGYIDLYALSVLVVTAWLGIRLAGPFRHRIGETVHVRSYLVLLSLVLVVMVAA